MDITELKPKILFPEPVAAKDAPPKGELFKLPKVVPVSDLAFASVVSEVEVVAGAENAGGIAEKPNLVGGSFETKDAALEPKRLLAEAVELPDVKAEEAEKAGLVANSPLLEVLDGALNEKIPLVDTASNLPLLPTASCELSN